MVHALSFDCDYGRSSQTATNYDTLVAEAVQPVPSSITTIIRGPFALNIQTKQFYRCNQVHIAYARITKEPLSHF